MQVEGLRLRPDPPPRVRLFSASDLHVTLGFLGAVSEKLALSGWARIAGFPSFRCVTGSFTGVEPLGHPRKPSALSAVVDRGRKELSEMIAEARGPLLSAAGAPEDHRPPLPHMTLARIQRRANSVERRAALAWAKAIDLEGVTFNAPSVALYTWSKDRQERLFQIVEQLRFER
jgi:2'-5' RNA ligase